MTISNEFPDIKIHLHLVQVVLDGLEGLLDKGIVLQDKRDTWVSCRIVGLGLGRKSIKICQCGVDMTSQVVQRVGKVLAVVSILGFFVTPHAGIEKGSQFKVGVGFEDTVKDKIVNLGGDFTVLVKQEILKAKFHVLHVFLQIHKFAEGSGGRLVKESVGGKQRRGVGSISQSDSQGLSGLDGSVRVNGACIIVVFDIEIWVCVVVEIIDERSNSSARRRQGVRTCEGNIVSPLDKFFVGDSLLIERSGEKSFFEVNKVRSFFHLIKKKGRNKDKRKAKVSEEFQKAE